MRIFPFCLALMLCVLSIQLLAQGRFKYSRAEADTILIDFDKAVEEYHPFAYRGNGQQKLDSVFSVVQKKIPTKIEDDSIHVAELIQLISAYNDLIGDGHFQLSRKRDSSYTKRNKLYNYEFYTRYVDDGRIVLSDTLILLDSTTFYPGTEVLTFQGEPVKILYKRIGSFIGLNDHNLASAKTYFPALDPGSFYQRLYGWKDSLVVDLRIDGRTQQISILPSARIAFLNKDTSETTTSDVVKKPTRKQKKDERIARMEQLLKLDTTTNPDVYLFSIRTFSGNAFKRVNEYIYVRQVMKRLDSLQAKGLIFDLRNNTGGSLNFVNHFYSMIADSNFYSGDEGIGYSKRARGRNFFGKLGNTIFGGVRKYGDYYTKKSITKRSKPEKGDEHFDGEVIVLVNETTFSGGTVLANYVQTYRRGKVVGQIAGGSSERMYAGVLFKEPIGPEKSLLINMPLWYMDMPGDNIGNVTPDVIVPRTAEAIEAQRDETLEVALKQFSFFKESL